MQKICSTLANNGYNVLLLGVEKFKPIEPLTKQPFNQKRLPLFFKSHFLSFAESNLRFFLYLLFKKFDAICAIDLDTIIPVYLLSVIKRKKRIYDGHELTTEMYSVLTKKKIIVKFWNWIERIFLPHFKNGYTVNESLSAEFNKMYGLQFQPVFNAPVFNASEIRDKCISESFILYQGVVNKDRGFQSILPAMKIVNANLKVCGDGNYLSDAKQLVKDLRIEDKVEFVGNVLPDDLRKITQMAYIGLNTVERLGMSNYLSLSNRTFDYMHAGVPQLAMNFPEYRKINDEFEIAVLINELDEKHIVDAINLLINDKSLYQKLQRNCLKASQKYNWTNEEKKLLIFYKNLFLEKP